MGDYDPVHAREGKPVPPWARAFGASGNAAMVTERRVEKENLRPGTAGREAGGATKKAPPGGVKTPRGSTTASMGPSARETGGQNQGIIQELREKVSSQNDELQDLRGTLDALERERDYYFAKLR